jgi:DNA-binding NarL/FixJ family response regulator
VIIRTQEGEKVFAGMEEKKLMETREIADISDIKEIASRKKDKARQTEDTLRLKRRGLDKKEIAAILGIREETVSHRLDGI